MLSPSLTSTSISPCTITISLKITSGKERRIFVGAGLVFGSFVVISPVGPDGRAKLAEADAATWLIGATLAVAMNWGDAGGIAIALIAMRGNLVPKFCCRSDSL